MKKKNGAASTFGRLILVLVEAAFVLLGGVVLGVTFFLNSDYVNMQETTLDEDELQTDYLVDMLVIDLLTAYTDEYEESTTYYCLAAFADGEGDVNLCVFEVFDYDACCDEILTYLEDDTQYIGNCWVNGIYTFFSEEDSALYTDELAEKDSWLSENQDNLSELCTLFGLDSSANVVDTGRVVYTWDDEESYYSSMSITNTVIRVIGGGMILLGLVGLWAVLRFTKGDANGEPETSSPQGQMFWNRESGRWESAEPQETPEETAPRRTQSRTGWDEDTPRPYDPEAYTASRTQEPWSGSSADDPWEKQNSKDDW